MSNDQSPPARRIIPYKKGGRRQSPFSEMAFQFSGTALDVAIQQRELDADDPLPETRTQNIGNEDSPLRETEQADGSSTQAPQNHTDSTAQQVTPSSSVIDGAKLSPPPARQKAETIEKPRLSRNVLLLPPNTYKPANPESIPLDLQIFIDRWKPFLTDTQIGICVYIYGSSTAIGQEYCFTSTAKLMIVVSKTERQVKTVINQLIDWEILIKGETVINAPRQQRGTHYKLNPDKY